MKRDMRECASVPGDGRYHCLRGCGDSWERDPRVSVVCPACGAKAGTDCIAPSEHRKSRSFSQPHKARRQLAFSLNPCHCLAKWDAEHSSQPQGELQLGEVAA